MSFIKGFFESLFIAAISLVSIVFGVLFWLVCNIYYFATGKRPK